MRLEQSVHQLCGLYVSSHRNHASRIGETNRFAVSKYATAASLTTTAALVRKLLASTHPLALNNPWRLSRRARGLIRTHMRPSRPHDSPLDRRASVSRS